MKITSLKNLIVLSRCSSMNEAAKKLFIAQPSLSKSIRLMEEELGFELFHRSRTGIELTEYGRVVAEDARHIVELYDNWLALPDKDHLKIIRIYGNISFSDFLLPATIVRIKEKYPELTINYRSEARPEDYITLDINEPVLALTVCDEETREKLTRLQGNPPIEVMRGSYQCLLNAQNPLSGKHSISVGELDEMFLMLPVTSGELQAEGCFLEPIMHNIIHTVGGSHVIEVDSLKNVVDSVRDYPRSYAVSFYPALYRYPGVSEGALAHVPFEDQKTEGSLCLFYSEAAVAKYPEIDDFIDLLLQAADDFMSSYGIRC